MTVHFIGAGPGAADLITVRGRDLIAASPVWGLMALEGHRMNIELAKAYGVDTTWSKASETRATQVMDMLADDTAGHYVTPTN